MLIFHKYLSITSREITHNGPALGGVRVCAQFHYHPLIMKYKSNETKLNYKTPHAI